MPVPLLRRLCLAACLSAPASLVCAETWPAADWARGPSPQGAAVAALEAYAFPPRDEVERTGVRTDALLVIRNGQLIYERYAGETRADSPHLTWSISKSLLAAILGVAYGEGRFQLEDAVARHYPPFAAHPQVRLEHLLHWASGLAWQEDYEYAPLQSSVVAMLYTRGRGDMAAFTAGHGLEAVPGQHFRYSSGDSTVLAAALRGMVGEQAYPDYPWSALFEPLGIRSAVWERDASGTFVGSSYCYMSARDLARVGLLMQRGGRWGEAQLLPADWVDFMRTPFVGEGVSPGGGVPGGHWWLNRAPAAQPRPWPDAPEDTFAALGHWGQGLYVMPSEGLVVVRYADDREPGFDTNRLLALVRAAYGREARP